jgi:hypothetical protein
MLPVLLGLSLLAQSATPASSVKLTPAVVGEINLASLKGKLLRQLAWSPDGSELYLQTYNANPDASIKEVFHYSIAAATGQPKSLQAAPAWAASYWQWKSAQSAPGDPTFKIEVGEEKKIINATAAPMAGDLIRGNADPGGGNGASVESVASAARGATNANVYTLRLKGEIVGEWVNHPIMPGLTFGWGPEGTGLIAFAEKDAGRLVLFDKTGAKQKIEGTKSVVLPAWTADGTRLAYLEGRGRNKYAIVIAAVSR